MSFKSWWNSWAPSWLDFKDVKSSSDVPDDDTRDFSTGEQVTTGTGFSSSSGNTYSNSNQIKDDLNLAQAVGVGSSGYSGYGLAQLGLYGYEAYLATQQQRLNRDTLDFNKEMSEAQLAESKRQFDTNFSQSEYWNQVSQNNYLNQNQIAVADMAKAGLNPLLAAGASSANNISPAQSSGVSGNPVAQLNSNALISLLDSARQRLFERQENAKNRDLAREEMASRERIAESQYLSSLYSSDKGLEGTKYSSDKGFEGTKYSSDKSFEGTKYSSDSIARTEANKLAALQDFNAWYKQHSQALLDSRNTEIQINKEIASSKLSLEQRKLVHQQLVDNRNYKLAKSELREAQNQFKQSHSLKEKLASQQRIRDNWKLILDSVQTAIDAVDTGASIMRNSPTKHN